MSLSVSHLPLVQTAERCRLFVTAQDRNKLHPEYGGSWYQPARKKNGVITQTFLSVFQSGRSYEDVGRKGKYSSTDSLTSALDAAKWKASWGGRSLRRGECRSRRHVRELHETQSRSGSCGEEKIPILLSWDRASLIYSSTSNKMQRYTMGFITIIALHVSGGSSAHHQELKTVHTASGICLAFSASYRYRE
jgi:hypothetical protein